MAELLARGPRPGEEWRKELPKGRELVLGRREADLAIHWDPKVSRKQATLNWDGERLRVRAHPEATNPVVHFGREVEDVALEPGERFFIGETIFQITDELAADLNEQRTAPPTLVEGFTVRPEELRRVRYRDADNRLDVLSRLPDLIAKAADERQLEERTISLLLQGIPTAEAAAIVSVSPDESGFERVLYSRVEQRREIGMRFRPSRRLILEAKAQRQSVYHVWTKDEQNEAQEGYTVSERTSWAFCTPVRSSAIPWRGLYVEGQVKRPRGDVEEDVKFADLAASVLGSLSEVRTLQRREGILGQCFSPALLRALADRDAETVLAPRETEVTVLFCDLRGFSSQTERDSGDLLGLLNRISQALGVMTEQIFNEGGVIGDFQGDAAMGFWGWPLPQEHAAAQACRAALAIGRRFAEAAREPQHPLAGFQVGIGIATGRAVAGKLGPADQAKFSVFGPVVNLASRLEGLTKIFRAPVLLDEETARRTRELLSLQEARFRRLARVIPVGMRKPLDLTELLPPVHSPADLPDEQIAAYEAGLDAFIAGDWSEANRLFAVVSPDDQAKDFLTGLILSHHRKAPEDWDGIIRMQTKS